MKIKRSKSFTQIIIVLIITLTALVVVAMTTKVIKFSVQKSQDHTPNYLSSASNSISDRTDKQLLKKYAQLLTSIDPSRTEYLQIGSVKVLQEKDSTVISPEMSFMVARKNNDCYYRLGATETYNLNGVYIYINHNTKKVMVTKQKQMSGASFDLAKFPKRFKDEGYELSSLLKNGKCQIRLINPEHLAYKEYSLSYDTVSNRVTEIFTRTANETRPESHGQGKLIYVSFSKIADEVDLKKYDPFEVVKQKEGQWQLQQRFKGYELIVI
jgi:hypothetical protein